MCAELSPEYEKNQRKKICWKKCWTKRVEEKVWKKKWWRKSDEKNTFSDLASRSSRRLLHTADKDCFKFYDIKKDDRGREKKHRILKITSHRCVCVHFFCFLIEVQRFLLSLFRTGNISHNQHIQELGPVLHFTWIASLCCIFKLEGYDLTDSSTATPLILAPPSI